MTEFFQQLVNGLAWGSIYALIALGYTMVYGVLRLINFAHGDVYMVGAFVGFFVAGALGAGAGLAGGAGLGVLLLVLVGAMVAASVLGYGIERLAYRPLRSYPRMAVLITAIGVSLLIENLGIVAWGGAPRSFPSLLGNRSFDVGGVSISSAQILIFVVSGLLALGLDWIIYNTRLGTAMRAVSFNLDVSKLMGIDTDRIVSFTFVLGSALAAAGGVLTAQFNPQIDPLMGIMTGLKAFVAAVLGGIGSLHGALLGGLLIGLAETFVVGYGSRIGIPSTYRDAVAFAILILVLLVRPTGILGRPLTEKV